MSEAEWSSDVEQLAKPPTKRIPGWVWGCGAGCLLFAIVAVLLLAVGFRFFAKGFDQDVQWERVAEVLPVDEPPPGIHVFGFPVEIEGTSMWILTDTARGVQGVLFSSPPSADASQTRRELLDPSQEVSIGGFGRHEVEAGEVEVQGRRLRCLRYTSLAGDGGKGPLGAFQKQMQGSSLVVDLTPEDEEGLLALILTKNATSERVSDEELRAFLEPFRIPGGIAGPAALPGQSPEQPSEPPPEPPPGEDR